MKATIPQIARQLKIPDHRVRFAVRMAFLVPDEVHATCHLYDLAEVTAALAKVGKRAHGRKIPVTAKLADLLAESGYQSHRTLPTGNIGIEYLDKVLLVKYDPNDNTIVKVLDTLKK